MKARQKIASLKKIIYESLTPLIGRKCILLDAPYYHNVGDVLIWTGEQSFLNDNGIECLYTASYETCTFPKIGKDVTVLFNGGGNLGDLYHEHMDFLLSVIRHYPYNRVIVLPQTIYYEDVSLEEKDFKELLSHEDLYICCRDKVVYNHIQESFGSKALLLPDMAFCISESRLQPYIKKETNNKLIIEREDCEKSGSNINGDGVISDWPVFMYSFKRSTFLNKIFKRIADAKILLVTQISNRIWNWYALRFFQKLMIKEGVEFISPYKTVETTRLHGCILSILLDKQIVLVNNSYGKNKNFFDTWLYDLDSIKLQ